MAKEQKKHSAKAERFKEALTCYLMISPQLIGFALFTVYPILWVARFAFTNYTETPYYRFVGFDNFIRCFQDSAYWMSIVNTVIVSFGKLIIELPLALILAIVVNNKLKGNGLFRTIYFLPNVVSSAIMGLIFSFIFGAAGGIVNAILMKLGLTDGIINFFGNKWLALMVVGIASVWHSFGINMLYFMAGIQQIPKDLYECADIDGANKWQQFRFITLPMLAPLAQVICMLAILGSLKMSDIVLTLTDGAPAGQSEVLMTYIYKNFFPVDSGIVEVGYGASMGIITAFLLGGMTVLYLKITAKANELV